MDGYDDFKPEDKSKIDKVSKNWGIIFLIGVIICFFFITGMFWVVGSSQKVHKSGTSKSYSAKTKVGSYTVNGTRVTSEETALNTGSLAGQDFVVVELPAETVNFLKTKSEIKDLYNQDKKIVVYLAGLDCPYGQMFQSAVEEEQNKLSNNDYYNFYPLTSTEVAIMKQEDIDEIKNAGYEPPEGVLNEIDGNAKIDFNHTCSLFCIIKPDKNLVLSFSSGVGRDEAPLLSSWLEQLKSW